MLWVGNVKVVLCCWGWQDWTLERMWSLHIYCGCTGWYETALTDPRETAAELRAWDMHWRRHHSHRPPKIKLSFMAVGLVHWRHCLRLPVILSCHLCYSLYSTERTKVRLLPTEHFLLKLAAFHVQVKWAVFFLDRLASELHGARSHLKMTYMFFMGLTAKAFRKQKTNNPGTAWG